MNPAFLLIADVILLLRLPLLLSSDPSRPSAWRRKSIIEVLALGLLTWKWSLLGAAAALVAANELTVLTLGRFKHKESCYLLWGVVQMAALSFLLSPASDIRVRPFIADFGSWLCGHSSLGWPLVSLLGVRSLVLVAGLLIAGNEANLLIRLTLDFLKLKPNEKASEQVEYNRGRVIGLFERALIYAFVISTQYQSIALILAAKAFARYKKLEQQEFAEYVLIGTLLSAAIAMGGAVLVRAFLPAG